jgi:predicted PurR-regulated permease PerM
VKKPDPALLRLLIFVGALVALALVLVFAGGILLPLLLGLVLAYLLDPPVSWLERRGWPRALGATVVFAAAVAAFVGVLFLVVPAIGDQLAELRERLPGYRAQVEARFLPWLEQIRGAYPEQFDFVRAKAEETVREKRPQLLQSGVAWLGGIFSSVMAFLLFLLDLIFVPVFAFYLLVDFPKLKEGIRSLIPLPYREPTLDRLGEVNDAVSSFLRGQLTIAVILAAINGVGLSLIGVPMGLLVGIVAGLANMIPYMALVVGLAPALLLSWIEHQSIGRLLAVALVFTGAQLLEGTVLSPKILSKSVNLHPVWILLAIILGGRWFGLPGMLVAVPAAAGIQVFVRHWLVAYRRTAVYRGDAPPAAAAPAAQVAVAAPAPVPPPAPEA